jgi:hypothetical protein
MIEQRVVTVPARPVEPERQEERAVGVICDLCKVTKSPEHGPDVNWALDGVSMDEITVSREVGKRYPETGWSTVTAYHVCPPCWETKLVPYLASLTAEPTEKEKDW